MSKYGAALQAEGVAEVDDLVDLEEEEQDELAETVGMKPIERKRLRRHLQHERQRLVSKRRRALHGAHAQPDASAHLRAKVLSRAPTAH